jgi:tricorn protease-like protein
LKKGETAKKLPVGIQTQAISNSDNYISINGGVKEMAISPDGKEIAFIARGEVFVTSVDGALTKRITNTPEQERFVEFGPEGKSIIYSSERDGKWRIFESRFFRNAKNRRSDCGSNQCKDGRCHRKGKIPGRPLLQIEYRTDICPTLERKG